MRTPSILIVDNGRSSRIILRDGLVSEGYRVFESEEWTSEIAHILQFGIDLVILNLDFRNGSARELIEQLRLAQGGQQLSIIGLIDTVHAGQETIDQADLTDYIVKPVNPKRLLEMVRLYLPLDSAGSPNASS